MKGSESPETFSFEFIFRSKTSDILKFVAIFSTRGSLASPQNETTKRSGKGGRGGGVGAQ